MSWNLDFEIDPTYCNCCGHEFLEDEEQLECGCSKYMCIECGEAVEVDGEDLDVCEDCAVIYEEHGVEHMLREHEEAQERIERNRHVWDKPKAKRDDSLFEIKE